VQAITGFRDVCAGDTLVLQSGASGGAPGSTIAYQWMVNGQPVPGANSATFSLPTAGAPGVKMITVSASAGGQNATSGTVTVTVRPLLPPTITFAVNPSTVLFTDPAIALRANANAPNACNGNLTITYSGEGVTGNNFNPGAVGGFNPANRLALQTRTIPLTATVRDAHNQAANANANVTVNLRPAASRRDIVFPNRSARVNNAAKRYLIEELTPQLRADPNSTVILIGHRDTGETGRAAATLDTQRVNNTAAVLSAGKGVCPALDLSRVQVESVGTDQTDPPLPFGDASVRERTGQAATDQRAQFRRVEIWFVPGGADQPGVTGLMPAPAPVIRRLGCPR
jgi:outer membrane protein OmpA-like peptidoglycan-associated protein